MVSRIWSGIPKSAAHILWKAFIEHTAGFRPRIKSGNKDGGEIARKYTKSGNKNDTGGWIWDT